MLNSPLLLSSHDGTDLILPHTYRICLCCSKQRMGAWIASAPYIHYKPRERGETILELESFSSLEKAFSLSVHKHRNWGFTNLAYTQCSPTTSRYLKG